MKRLSPGVAGGEPEAGQADSIRVRLLGAMAESGCPICLLAREQERRYFFWFFAENYHGPETIAQLGASHGFCFLHARRLAAQAGAEASALAAVYELLTRKLAAELETALQARDGSWPRTSPESCPACASRARAERRFLGALAGIVTDAATRGAYQAPHLLCLSHLRGLEPLLGDAALGWVMEVHTAWLGTIMGREGPGGTSDPSGSLKARLVRDLDVADAYPPHRCSGEPRQGVERSFEEALPDDLCPVCRAQSEAYLAWAQHCEACLQGAEPVDDLLPICDEHVSAYLSHASAAVRELTVSQLARTARDLLARALRELGDVPPRSPFGRLMRLLSGEAGEPRRRARSALQRRIACPLCSMLSTTETRALELLAIRVQTEPGARRYGRGHGLCFRHLGVALLQRPGPAVARVLLDHARLDAKQLAWRLGEADRLDAWMARPLPKGSEASAWRRALYRFVGGLPGGSS